ncbi:MAG: class I SAM-dependent methyltransferase [Thermoplasmata archaeon]
MKKDLWEDLERSLEKIIPYYNVMNKVMSLGNEEFLREKMMDYVPENIDVYGDIGTGPGNISLKIVSERNVDEPFLIDPSMEMLKNNKSGGEKVCAIMEELPFKDETFDLVTCGFSFRDSYSHEDAAKEISRVIKNNGKLIILDIGKPDSKLLFFIYSIYIFFIPLLSSMIITKFKHIHEYFTLFYTYVFYPPHGEILKMFEKNGMRYEHGIKKMGGALFLDIFKKQG